MSAKLRYVVGIDLGTTNCGLAFAQAEGLDPRELPPVLQFEIPQLVNPGEVRDETLLPSSLYLQGPADFPEGSLALPWDANPPFVVGHLAKTRGAEAPRRLVASAKSWLCHSGVDRTSAILPTAPPEGTPRLSPVEASRHYLEHLRNAWTSSQPDAPFDEQQLLVTVPASFDAVARELTARAAAEAGLKNVVLLEEPQAAFYAWIERHPDWRERVHVGDLILVVDIGGGTTDFSLIAVTERDGELQLERVAVGEHILLGGDNMDLALARFIEQELAEKGKKLDQFQLHALWQNCRVAKEKLLEEGVKGDEHPVTILGKGTGVVGGTIKAKLRRADMERILLDGFFPQVSSEEMPMRQRRVALQEVGLPYAADAAVTRHMARFLRQQAAASEHGVLRRGTSGLVAPTHVLFNGGVLRAGLVRERLLATLNSWLAAEGFESIAALEGEDLMHAVSRGAAYYGLARQGRGVRIRGGIPRTYYVGIETAMPAVPGMPAPLKALTVAQFGMEEGTQSAIAQQEFGLLVGEPAEFRFFSSALRKDDPPGSLLEEVSGELEELAPMEVTLPADGDAGHLITVTLETVITETGQLQLWCVARDGRRWKLEFNVRERVAS
ncbi:MAG: Hsp70 family protein [Bryobacteraceae bacterium]|nr:Hsp70 family protein [Bryobacteraceae bacterium]